MGDGTQPWTSVMRCNVKLQSQSHGVISGRARVTLRSWDSRNRVGKVCSAGWVMAPCARGLWYQCFRTFYFSLQIRCDWGEDSHWQSDRILVTQSWVGEGCVCRVEVNKREWTWNSDKTFYNGHCRWERIVRNLPLYGPLHRLKKETRFNV